MGNVDFFFNLGTLPTHKHKSTLVKNSWTYFHTDGRSVAAFSNKHPTERCQETFPTELPQLALCSRKSSWSQHKPQGCFCPSSMTPSNIFDCVPITPSCDWIIPCYRQTDVRASAGLIWLCLHVYNQHTAYIWFNTTTMCQDWYNQQGRSALKQPANRQSEPQQATFWFVVIYLRFDHTHRYCVVATCESFFFWLLLMDVGCVLEIYINVKRLCGLQSCQDADETLSQWWFSQWT